MELNPLHELEQLSIGKGFISDPHCNHIKVKLCFALGAGSPTRIIVISTVKSPTPLTIGALIAKALDQDGLIGIHWNGDRHTSLPSAPNPGLPRQIHSKLERLDGHELIFRFSDFSFDLYGVVTPTDEERAAVASFSKA